MVLQMSRISKRLEKMKKKYYSYLLRLLGFGLSSHNPCHFKGKKGMKLTFKVSLLYASNCNRASHVHYPFCSSPQHSREYYRRFKRPRLFFLNLISMLGTALVKFQKHGERCWDSRVNDQKVIISTR